MPSLVGIVVILTVAVMVLIVSPLLLRQQPVDHKANYNRYRRRFHRYLRGGRRRQDLLRLRNLRQDQWEILKSVIILKSAEIDWGKLLSFSHPNHMPSHHQNGQSELDMTMTAVSTTGGQRRQLGQEEEVIPDDSTTSSFGERGNNSHKHHHEEEKKKLEEMVVVEINKGKNENSRSTTSISRNRSRHHSLHQQSAQNHLTKETTTIIAAVATPTTTAMEEEVPFFPSHNQDGHSHEHLYHRDWSLWFPALFDLLSIDFWSLGTRSDDSNNPTTPGTTAILGVSSSTTTTTTATTEDEGNRQFNDDLFITDDVRLDDDLFITDDVRPNDDLLLLDDDDQVGAVADDDDVVFTTDDQVGVNDDNTTVAVVDDDVVEATLPPGDDQVGVDDDEPPVGSDDQTVPSADDQAPVDDQVGVDDDENVDSESPTLTPTTDLNLAPATTPTTTDTAPPNLAPTVSPSEIPTMNAATPSPTMNPTAELFTDDDVIGVRPPPSDDAPIIDDIIGFDDVLPAIDDDFIGQRESESPSFGPTASSSSTPSLTPTTTSPAATPSETPTLTTPNPTATPTTDESAIPTGTDDFVPQISSSPTGGAPVTTREPTLVPTRGFVDIVPYSYSRGNCPNAGSLGVPCAPADLEQRCAKATGRVGDCLQICAPSICCIHDTPSEMNPFSPTCNTDENCAQYAPCYIVWWKLLDTVGPATEFRLAQTDDYFDIDIPQVATTDEVFYQQLFFHHFDDIDPVLEVVEEEDSLQEVFARPEIWGANSAFS